MLRLCREAIDDRSGWPWQLDCEFVEKALVQNLYAGDRGEAVGELAGFRVIEGG